MRIAINTRFLLDQKLGGFGWFTYETLKRIVTNHPEHNFFFIFDRPYHPRFIFAKNVTPVVAFPPARHPVLWYWWHEHSLPKIFKKIQPDIVISNDGYLSLNSNVKQIAIIHDLSFVHYPDELRWLVKKYLLNYFPKFARKAQRIITVSEYSKNDIINTYGINPDKIDIAYNGSNEIYKPLDNIQKEEAKRRFAQGCEYFIYIGSVLPRKNLVRLLKAFDSFKSILHSGTKLLIVGARLYKTGATDTAYKQMKHNDDVLFTGYLSTGDIQLALGGAIALTYVSYFEGFGIPIIEAMYSDVPVITSNITSMPEVAGDAAILVDPFSVENITNAMLLIYNDKMLRNSLIEKGRIRRQIFNWDKTAEQIWQSIEKCLADQDTSDKCNEKIGVF
jgi:glycosyltransferase involved in cell wall biosynthesis